MRRGWRFLIVGLMATCATLSNAAPPEQSLIPVGRPSAPPALAFLTTAPDPMVRPEPRPASPQILAVAARPADLPLLGPDTSLMPYLRPKALEQEALFKKLARRHSLNFHPPSYRVEVLRPKDTGIRSKVATLIDQMELEG